MVFRLARVWWLHQLCSSTLPSPSSSKGSLRPSAIAQPCSSSSWEEPWFCLGKISTLRRYSLGIPFATTLEQFWPFLQSLVLIFPSRINSSCLSLVFRTSVAQFPLLNSSAVRILPLSPPSFGRIWPQGWQIEGNTNKYEYFEPFLEASRTNKRGRFMLETSILARTLQFNPNGPFATLHTLLIMFLILLTLQTTWNIKTEIKLILEKEKKLWK